MNFRRIAASLSLDAGSYVRELELRVVGLVETNRVKDSRIAGLHASLDEVESANARFRGGVSNLRETVLQQGEQLRQTRLLARNAETAVLQLEEQLAASRNASDSLAADLRTERKFREDLIEKATQRINALETENDALREQLEMSPREKQLDLVPPPDVPAAEPEVVYDGVIEKVYQIAHVCFIDGHKWYFRDGGSEAFYAPIRDEEFNLSVARREVAFSSGDLIRVRLHQVSTRKGDNYKTVSEVTKVLGILPPPTPEQTTLLTEATAAS